MVCLDTTFLIDLINGRVPLEYLKNNFKDENLFIASSSIAELFRGLYLKSNLKNVKEDEEEETRRILSLFSTLDLGKNEAILAGKIDAELYNKGEIIDIEDVMIAAICVENSEILITRNKKHFEKIKDLKIQTY